MFSLIRAVIVACLILCSGQAFAQPQDQFTESAQAAQQQANPPTQQAQPAQPQPKQAPPSAPASSTGPTKAELDKIAAAAAAAAAKSQSADPTQKPPEPAQSFYPGLGVNINVPFLNGAWSDQFDMGWFGFGVEWCRYKRFSYCGIGTMFMIGAGGKSPTDGSKGERFVLTSSFTYSATKHIGVTIYPYWDPSRSKNSIGVGSGVSFIWKQWGGKLRPNKEQQEITINTTDSPK